GDPDAGDVGGLTEVEAGRTADQAAEQAADGAAVAQDGAELQATGDQAVQRVVHQATYDGEAGDQGVEALKHADRDGGGLDTGPAVSRGGGSLSSADRDLRAERGHKAVAEQRDAHAGTKLDVAVTHRQAEALDRGVERQQRGELAGDRSGDAA